MCDQETKTTWNTKELQEDFEVKGFCAPYVEVVRKSDGARGMLEFSGNPREYSDFRKTE